MAHNRQPSRPPPKGGLDPKRPVITGIAQGVAREVVYLVYVILRHWWHGGPW
jgi:hypothetical protein